MAISILITGASGNIGKASLSALAHHKNITVHAGVRDPSKTESSALAQIGENVKVVAADPLHPGFPETLNGIDYLFVVTPGHIDRTKIVVAAIDAAKAKNVKYILVISVLTADLVDTIFGAQFTPIEKAAKESGVPFTILRLPLFIDNSYGDIASVKAQNKFYGALEPQRLYTPVAVQDVGAVAAKILSHPEPHFGKTYKLSSPAFTPDHQAKVYSEVLGKNVTYVPVPYEGLKSTLLGFGFQEWQVDGINELNKLINSDSPVTNDPEGQKHIEQILGRPPTTIEAWVKQAAPAFQ